MLWWGDVTQGQLSSRIASCVNIEEGERGEDTSFDASGIDRHSGTQIRLNKISIPVYSSRYGQKSDIFSPTKINSTVRMEADTRPRRELVEQASNCHPHEYSNSCLLFSVGIVESSCLLRNHKTAEVYIYTSKARLFCER